MKKTLIAYAVAAMAFAAVSCGEKKTDSSPESGSPATTAEESADELMKDMLKKTKRFLIRIILLIILLKIWASIDTVLLK